MGDSVTVQLLASNEEMLPTAKVKNNTKGTSVDCNPDEVIIDDPPLSGMVCHSQNSSIPGLSNGDFMSILVSFTWLDNFISNVDKTVTIIDGDIGVMSNTQSFPCARVKIDNLTASN